MVFETKIVRYAHTDGHTDVCYSGDSRYLITCGSDGNVRTWCESDDDEPTADSVADVALAVACTDDQLFVATDNNDVQAFTFPSRKRDKIIFRFSAPVTQICISSERKYLAAGSCDMEVQVLNLKTNKITTLTGHTAPILGVSLDPAEEFIVSSSCDGTVKVWNISTESVIKTFHDVVPIRNDFFKAVCLGKAAWKSITGTMLAIPKDLEVNVYRRGTWEFLFKLKSVNIEKPLSVVLFSPCGNYVTAGSSGGEVVIWEIKYQSEVCNFKDPKKVGICGMVWRSDGGEIAYSDRLGRLSVLTGIVEEITKHTVPEELYRVPEVNDSEDELDNYMCTNELYDNDDDDDDNCISLEKIKAPYKNESEDERPGSRASSRSENPTEEPLVPITKRQSPFQPSSTPSHFEPRCLCFNSIGIVRYYDSDKTIDVQFHDTMFHHALFLRSFGLCTMAALSMNALCLAVHSVDDNPSKLSCLSLNSWTGSKEWTIQMPDNEEILAVAAGGSWVAAATSANQMRVFTDAGTQRNIVALPGAVVSMTGSERKLLVVCHMGIGVDGNQSEGFIVYHVSNLCVKALIPFQPLPLFPKSTLKWIGFSDEGTPVSYDSEGILRLLGHDLLHWEVACDTRNQKKSPEDYYFVVGLSERYQNVRCILCKNSFYPLVINTPTILEIPLKLPFCSLNTEKSSQEETFWRILFSLQSLEKASVDKTDIQSDVASFEQTLKQTSLKLFAEACQNSEENRALDVATLMSNLPLEMAIKYASKVGKLYLAEKLNSLIPVDWKNPSFEPQAPVVGNSETENSGSSDMKTYSQDDLSQDYPISIENEDRYSVTTEWPQSQEFIKLGSVNPFRKKETKSEGLRGLKLFNAIVAKEAKKPQFPTSKPLKLKAPRLFKEKSSEDKVKKQTFIEWFASMKSSLSQEYPNVSASELTKLGTKLYKEGMCEENEDAVVEKDSRKRSLETDSIFEAKRYRSFEDS